MRSVIAAIGFAALLGPAYAFDFTAGEFGDRFNLEAERQGSTLRVTSEACTSPADPIYYYQIAGVHIVVSGQPGSKNATKIATQSGPVNGTIELNQAQPIIAAVTSPNTDITKRNNYLFALQTAYDEDEVGNPRVKIILEGVRYLRQRLPNGTGESFTVTDKGYWSEEPKSLPSAQTAESPTPPSTDQTTASATTKDTLGDQRSSNYRNVDAADLWVSPGKFKGKPVELRKVQCFYADANEYRCLAPNEGSPVMILAPSVSPDVAKSTLEDDCGTIKAVDTPKCTRTIHFIPLDSEEDTVNAFSKRVVIVTREIEIVPRNR